MIITVETKINASIDQVWECWTMPKHITNWNFASEDWCCPSAINELTPGGKFNWRMESKDNSMGFDFTGTYANIEEDKLITYKISDGREVVITFEIDDDRVKLTESFEAEDIHTGEQQRAGWQAILENFKKYVESKVG